MVSDEVLCPFVLQTHVGISQVYWLQPLSITNVFWEYKNSKFCYIFKHYEVYISKYILRDFIKKYI